MKKTYVYGSLTRITDLETEPFAVLRLPREDWATGDYVVGRYIDEGVEVELSSGRFAHMMRGDLMVGALGARQSTLEAVGDWRSIGSDGHMEDLTGAGLFGRETSHSSAIPPSPPLELIGHVVRNGRKVCMKDFVRKVSEDQPTYDCPTIVLIGTSMSSGKTTAARVIIRLLKDMGIRRVIGTKLAGAGYHHDILAMHDAGADAVFDFVDAGLPSSIVPPDEYRESLKKLISLISAEHPDVVVAEAGASPFEPYNGLIALQEIGDRASFVVLCAGDPYAVLGLIQAFGIDKPNIVSGIVTATSAGIELVEEVSGVPAMSLQTEESVAELRELLSAIVLKPKSQAECTTCCAIDGLDYDLNLDPRNVTAP